MTSGSDPGRTYLLETIVATDMNTLDRSILTRWHVPSALGVLSVGLGLAALLAPRKVATACGISRARGMLPLVGARELASGAGLLSGRQTSLWLWSRVIGDVMDLAVLATAHERTAGGRRRVSAAAAVVGAITAADVVAAVEHSRESGIIRGHATAPDVYVDRTVIINKTPQECYEFWKDLTNIPRFTPRLRSVTVRQDGVSHWVLSLPGGGKVEWDSRVTVDRPGERLSWRSVSESPFSHAGSVQFSAAPAGRGTFVSVSMHYRSPVSATLAKLVGGDPFGEIREDLRRFKQLIKTGEIPTTVGQPSGRRSWLGRVLPEGRKSRQPGRTTPSAGSGRSTLKEARV
jgi:uncharacterized membrane protein